MEIFNPDFLTDLKTGRPINLDLGSGGIRRDGFYGVDRLQLQGVDIVADFNHPLTLIPNDSVAKIYSSHVLEHVQDINLLMSEIHRITQPNGIIEIVVPHFSNVYGYSDPTHVRLFGLYSMHYYTPKDIQPSRRKVPDFYTNVAFKINSITLEFYRLGILDRLLTPLLSRLVNHNISSQDFYERRLSYLLHARQIRYELTPIKFR